MRIAALPALALLAGCAGTASRTTTDRPPTTHLHMTVEPIVETTAAAAELIVEHVEPALPAEPVEGIFPAGIRSVRFLRTTTLLAAPRADADKIGVIRTGARAAATDARPGDDDCDGRWIAIAPRGWACESSIEPTTEAPTTAVAHALTDEPDDDRPLVPGTYGTVRGNAVAYESREDALAGTNGRALVGSNSVRVRAIVTIGDKRFWKTTGGDLIEASSIRRFSPSTFRGVVLGPGDPMPAWARNHSDPKEPVVARATPSSRGKVLGTLEPRTIVEIYATSKDGKWVRVEDEQWISRKDVRVATLTAPPEGAGPDERWFDVDLEDQVLVAYQGSTPVYATLVSTGKRGHRTPARITRVKSKLERATMASDDDEVYSVADVPWTMYYDDPGYALHTSYWHNGFGGPRSHGCINLAPHDARVLYHWSSPDVPPGWVAVYGDENNPGSLVRVRSRKVPEPAYRGYARRMLENERS
jgi:hypothetical protein